MALDRGQYNEKNNVLLIILFSLLTPVKTFSFCDITNIFRHPNSLITLKIPKPRFLLVGTARKKFLNRLRSFNDKAVEKSTYITYNEYWYQLYSTIYI